MHDALDRLLPTLENRAAAERIRLALLDLNAQLESDQGSEMRNRLQSLRRAIESYDSNPSSEADIAAIRLVMDLAELTDYWRVD